MGDAGFMAMPRTEVVEDRFEGIDLWPTADALAALAEGQIPTALSPAESVFGWADGPRVVDAPFVDH